MLNAEDFHNSKDDDTDSSMMDFLQYVKKQV